MTPVICLAPISSHSGTHLPLLPLLVDLRLQRCNPLPTGHHSGCQLRVAFLLFLEGFLEASALLEKVGHDHPASIFLGEATRAPGCRDKGRVRNGPEAG